MVGITRGRGDKFMPAEMEWAPGQKVPAGTAEEESPCARSFGSEVAKGLTPPSSPAGGNHARHVDLTPIIVISAISEAL